MMRIPETKFRNLPCVGVAVAVLCVGCAGYAGTFTPNPRAPLAWGEAIGWINACPGQDNAMRISGTVARGFLWSESAGWINLGDGTPDEPPHYSNKSATDFGVNHDGLGGLYGLAWGEAIGWINFDTRAAGGSQVCIEPGGQMSGYAWSESAGWINFDSGYGVQLLTLFDEGEEEGEGSAEGEGEGEGEGSAEGEGNLEGQTEGSAEGEGHIEAENTGQHSADQNGDGAVNLTELLRVIQFFNAQGYHCAPFSETSEDGYLPSAGENHRCAPHASDYNPQDWQIALTELLRLIQFFNVGAYHPCPAQNTEDGYCPGP